MTSAIISVEEAQLITIFGFVPKHGSSTDQFKVDGANAARAFLLSQRIAQQGIDDVCAAIALHTSPGTLQSMHPVVALVTARVELDVLGVGLADFVPRHVT